MRNPRSTTEIDTDQSYDDKGREWASYQPHYVNDPVYLNARKQYDEFSRVTDIVTNDELGNAQTTHTDYHGLETDVTNPAGQTKKDFLDALGQLARKFHADREKGVGEIV